MASLDPTTFFTYNHVFPTGVYPMASCNSFGSHSFFGPSNASPTSSYTLQAPSSVAHSQEIAKDPSWYINSGATNTLTNDSGKLLKSTIYVDYEKILVRNSTALNIQRIISALFATISYESLVLNHILHIPHITKNLLSVSKLITDNNVTIEFLENFYFAKARSIGIILLKELQKVAYNKFKVLIYSLKFT